MLWCQAPQTLRTLFSCRKIKFWVKVSTLPLQPLVGEVLFFGGCFPWAAEEQCGCLIVR